MDWRLLHEKRAELVKKAGAIIEAAQLEKRGFADAERQELAALNSDIDQLKADIELVERTTAQELRAPALPRRGEEDEDRLPTLAEQSAAQERKYPRPFKSLGEQLQAVAGFASGHRDERLFKVGTNGDVRAAVSGASSHIPSDGGFLVQSDFTTELLRRATMGAMLFPRTRQIPIGPGSDSLAAVTVDETSRATGSRWGGIQIYRANEAETVTAKRPKFGKIELRLEDLRGLAYVPDRLLQDAVALEAIMMDAFTEEFAVVIDNEIINGTGDGQCLGILQAPALVSQAKEGSQAATTLVYNNIVKMRARFPARFRGDSVWLINQDVEPQLMGLSLAVGTGGGAVYMPANGLSVEPFDTLFGRPILPMEQCATLGTVGDIIYVAPRQYLTITKGGVEAAQSMHVQFITHEMTFRFNWRVNGQPIWGAALTPMSGSGNTLSPYVAVATRA